MEKEMSFHILGIEETKDENAVKMAYRKLLKALSACERRTRLRRHLPRSRMTRRNRKTAEVRRKRLRLTRGSAGSTSATAMYTAAPMSRRGGSFWRIRSVMVWIRRWKPESGFWPI